MLADDIKKIIKGEVFTDSATLTKFSQDASIFEVQPQVVVAPTDSADISALVKFVSEARKFDKKLSLTPRAAGSDMSGGPLTDSIALDMTAHFNRILDITTVSAAVEPGVYYRDFDAQTKRQNVFLPSYPASRELCTVGGMVANNSGGEKTLSYGKTENFILELKVVLSDGNEYVIKPISKKELELKMKQKNFEGQLYKKLYEVIVKNQDVLVRAKPKVTKNSAGYYLWNVWDGEIFDLTKLIVGSQGTLGIITEIKFRLVPVKPVSKLAVIFLKDLKPLANVALQVMKHGPESFESYDDHTIKLAIKFFPAIIKRVGTKHILPMLVQFFPEALRMLTGGLPKLVMLAEFTGKNDEEVDKKLATLKSDLAAFPVHTRITKTEAEAKRYWIIRRESFNLLRSKVKDRRTAPFIDDIVVQMEKLPEFLPNLTALLDKYDLLYTIAGHVGDGNFHIIPLMNLADPGQRAIIPRLSDEVYDLVVKFGGSITAEHNDGLIRTPYLEKMYGAEVVKLFAETKAIFDPENIFNPGKKSGGSLAFSLSHVNH